MHRYPEQKESGLIRPKNLTYSSYLKVDQLLQLQDELSNPPHHDEMFFIIIHQAAELWFKEILHETDRLVEAFEAKHLSESLKVLRRLTAIMELQVKQINLLATLTPAEFAGFRDNLRPASGFQSVQFRLIEFAYGLRDPFFLKFFEHQESALAALERWKNRPSVYEALLTYLKSDGPAGDPEKLLKKHTRAEPNSAQLSPERLQVLSQLLAIYENPQDNYLWLLLCETLLDFDEKFSQWRSTHVLMVGRTIGEKIGTGGSSGIKFLQSRMDYRFFPDLWTIRGFIGTQY